MAPLQPWHGFPLIYDNQKKGGKNEEVIEYCDGGVRCWLLKLLFHHWINGGWIRCIRIL